MQSLLENCLKLKPSNSHFWNEDDGRNSIHHRQSIHRVCDPRTGTEQILSASCFGHKVSATFITGWSTSRSFCWLSTNQAFGGSAVWLYFKKPDLTCSSDAFLAGRLARGFKGIGHILVPQAVAKHYGEGLACQLIGAKMHRELLYTWMDRLIDENYWTRTSPSPQQARLTFFQTFLLRCTMALAMMYCILPGLFLISSVSKYLQVMQVSSLETVCPFRS